MRACLCVHVHVWSHSVHVDAVGVGPGVLEVLLQPLAQATGDLVEADELLDAQHLGVVARCARVQPLDDGRHVAEDAGVHQRCRGAEQRDAEDGRPGIGCGSPEGHDCVCTTRGP